MVQYPMNFPAGVQATSGMGSPFSASAHSFPPIQMSIPKEFNGPGTGYSPEDLFTLAVTGCLIATFKVFAEKTGLAYTEIKGDAVLTIDRNVQGMPELQKLDLTFTLSGVTDQEKAKAMLAESEKYCLVSNATSTLKTFTYNFT